MSATARRLEIDEIAGHLDQIRAGVIGASSAGTRRSRGRISRTPTATCAQKR